MRQTRSKFLRLPGCAFTLLAGITQWLKMVNFLLFNSARADFCESTLLYALCLGSASGCNRLGSCIYFFGGEVGGRSVLISLCESCIFCVT